MEKHIWVLPEALYVIDEDGMIIQTYPKASPDKNAGEIFSILKSVIKKTSSAGFFYDAFVGFSIKWLFYLKNKLL